MDRVTTLLLVFPITLLTTPPAYADVNMMEASYRTNFIDVEMAGLKIQRRYDSRSTLTGAFGFGWCSTFDTHLEISRTNDGRSSVAINDCGKITSGPTVTYSNGKYSQHLPTGLVRTFDADTGQLVSLRAASSRLEVAVTRSRLPRAAALGEGFKERPNGKIWINLQYDSLGETVTTLETSSGKRLEFTYSADRDLLSAKNAWSNTYHFTYDRLHNLESVNYPDQTSETMTYDSDRDQLLSYKGRDGCEETYSHQVSEKSPNERNQVSIARLICDGRLKRQVGFEFTFRRSTSSSWQLANLKINRSAQ